MRSIEFFDRGHDLGPSRTCIVDGTTEYSFAEVKALTERVARALHANGFANQDQIALYGPNSADMLVVLLSIWRANGKWIPVNLRNAADANIAYLNYVGCQWLFYHSSLAEQVRTLRQNCPELTHFVCLDRELDGDPSLEQFIDGHEAGAFEPIEVDPFGNLDDIVGIFPTGGTTGPAKGMNVTNLGWGTMLSTVAMALDGRTDDPRTLVTAPITHAAGPVSLASLSIGATQVILPGFDAADVLKTIEERGITHMYLPPTALYMLLDEPSRSSRDTSSLKILILVGSPVSPTRLAEAVEAFGPCLCQAYGQVESPMIMTWLSPEQTAEAATDPALRHRLASCGRPSHAARLAIMDEDGRLIANGGVGEIVSRGPLVSHSYYRKAEATAQARLFNWHHTGDLGYRDDDGFFYIVDRKKDMVITGGFNVFTAEVEAAVTELPQVRECAVIGLPHETWGEQVYACVVADGITGDQVIAHVKQRLGGVKAPKAVEFVASLPRTPAGKLDKKTLRAERWKGERNVN
jgi:acyl-CoA synthetase (AMP-forming)/AMP-acid ligase II